MDSFDDDIRWLRDQQPEIDLPEPEVSSRVRESVMAHADRAPRMAAVVAAPSSDRSRPRRRLIVAFSRPRRLIAMTAAVAAVAVGGYAATLAVSPSGHSGIDSAIAPGVANAQSLVLLADNVAAAPTKGDATLVVHRNAIKGEGTFTGADLYLDNGRYYYAETPSGLPAAIKSGPQDFSIKPIVDAMAATSNADPQAARSAFLKAADPLYGGNIQHGSVAQQDNVIWVSGIDVLSAAYGRPAVLAGTLRALSTVRGVTVKHSTYQGVKTLNIALWVPKTVANYAALKRSLEAKIRAKGGHPTARQKALLQKLDAAAVSKVSTPAHFERATVDARTGALMRYTDTGLVVTYHVSRVDSARYNAR